MTTNFVVVAADLENNAEEFWRTLEERRPDVFHQLRETDRAVIEQHVWGEIQRFPGFSGGPEYARQALIVIEATP